ncbi:CAAX protease self-immunity [Aquiflexum balticum DSM 16537]|uniref:CAAX protease self-immunity n=1 Tax=Aquiflexum balticum DSM 16537 TaxID=758820 RepID=A0A1W2H5S3_9BACT|nr:CAAX protease self-immunity [Aquiflexum balticum DSM 16537]
MIKRLLYFSQTGEIQEAEKELTPAFFAKLLFVKFGFLSVYILVVALVFGFEIFQAFESKSSKSIPVTFLNLIILAPVLEESIFRNHLNMKPKNLILAALIAVILFWDEGFIFIMLGYFTLVWLLRNRINPKIKLLLIYFSSLLFAYAHYYQFLDWNDMGTIMKVIFRSFPHFLSGIILSYLYFRNGILICMFFHGLWNLLPFFSEWVGRVF